MKKIIILSGVILSLANPALAEKKVKSSTTHSEQNSSQQSASTPASTSTHDGTQEAAVTPASDTVTSQNSATTTSLYTENDETPRVSKGGLYLEPMISAIREDSTLSSTALAANSTGSGEGYGVGLRLGGHVSEVLFLGIDGRYAKMQQSDGFSDKNATNIYNLAPMIGVQTPIWGIRVLASYVLLGENSPDANRQGVKLKFTEPRGWRLGAGLHAGPVGINLEYQDLKYNKAEIRSQGNLASNINVSDIDESTKGYALSLSFPIEL